MHTHTAAVIEADTVSQLCMTEITSVVNGDVTLLVRSRGAAASSQAVA